MIGLLDEVSENTRPHMFILVIDLLLYATYLKWLIDTRLVQPYKESEMKNPGDYTMLHKHSTPQPLKMMV